MEENPTTENSEAVIKMLSTSTNPLVAITPLPSGFRTGMNREFNRAMGFVSQRLRGQLRLVATCRHVFEYYDKGYEYIVTMRTPDASQLDIVGKPIFDTNPESDIAFLVVRDPKYIRTEPLVIGTADIPLPEKRTLYNAANRTDFVSSICEFFVARQQVVELNQWAFTKLSSLIVNLVPKTDLEKQEELLRDGWIKCRCLNMVSRVGYSGSPVWDDKLRLYGMDVRGSEPGPDYHGDIMVCIPSSEIYLARQRVNSQIERLLDSI